ncbi:MAG: ABC transporter permease [Micrococcales bacterium]|nr:ABC transporter permease [Micrococcales bacterium]MCL2541768.1 ABC transporter permease [Nocardioidaceae bacterium]MCL2614404.1 ABC transporter permease [Nocardioidaceae bacterium]
MSELTVEPEPSMPEISRPRVNAELTEPTAANGLVGVLQRRYLLKLLVRREISARYQGSFLGLMWSYINPLSHFFVYFVVMGTIFNLHKNVQNFSIHLFSGLVIVHFFTETFGAGTRSIVRNRSIVQKMALPREMFPVATMLTSLYHVVPQVVILVVAGLLLGWTPDPGGMIALILAIIMIMLIGLSAALVFSVANVFFRDFGNIVNVLLMFVRFGVPMMYPYTLVHERFGSFSKYYLLDPLAEAVLLFQRAFWVGTTDDRAYTIATQLPDHLLTRGCVFVGVSAVILVIAQVIFSRLENKIPERL